MSHVFVIAEAGISHDGDIDKAFRLIDAAREAKADAVKFQTFNAQRLAAQRKKPDLFTTLKKYEMPLSWLPQLKKHCDDAKIEFMTTCFDEETLKVVAPFVRKFKIGSAEAGNLDFVKAHLEYHKTVIVSAGLIDDEMCARIYELMPTRIQIIHCVSEYPCSPSKADVQGSLRRLLWGYSDHTRELRMGGLAVAAGAKIVEVHFRLWDTNINNPDWCVSHDPSSLIGYVEFIRQAQLAVYGADSEETKKLERPGSAPRSDRPQSSEGCGPSGDPQGAAS